MESDAGSGQVLKHYIWVEDRLLAVVARGTNAVGQSTAPAVYYAHTDHLGTPRKLTDGNAQVVWIAEYEPFGLASVSEDPDGDGTQIEFNLRFPGQYYDKYSGLNYNYFRDYDPTTGRYLQSDPIGLTAGPNTYAYVSGNPLTWFDPLGLLPSNCFLVKLGQEIVSRENVSYGPEFERWSVLIPVPNPQWVAYVLRKGRGKPPVTGPIELIQGTQWARWVTTTTIEEVWANGYMRCKNEGECGEVEYDDEYHPPWLENSSETTTRRIENTRFSR
jgi:RHS repeat-associated protein